MSLKHFNLNNRSIHTLRQYLATRTSAVEYKASENHFPSTPVKDFNWEVYLKPWTRFGPYALGIAMGHILYKTKAARVKINTVSRTGSKYNVFCGHLYSVVIQKPQCK